MASREIVSQNHWLVLGTATACAILFAVGSFGCGDGNNEIKKAERTSQADTSADISKPESTDIFRQEDYPSPPWVEWASVLTLRESSLLKGADSLFAAEKKESARKQYSTVSTAILKRILSSDSVALYQSGNHTKEEVLRAAQLSLDLRLVEKYVLEQIGSTLKVQSEVDATSQVLNAFIKQIWQTRQLIAALQATTDQTFKIMDVSKEFGEVLAQVDPKHDLFSSVDAFGPMLIVGVTDSWFYYKDFEKRLLTKRLLLFWRVKLDLADPAVASIRFVDIGGDTVARCGPGESSDVWLAP